MTWPQGTVADVMDREPVCAHEQASFRDVAAALDRAGVESAPVVDSERTVVGVVSVGDLLRRARRSWDRNRAPAGEGLTAGGLMTAPAVTVRPDAGITLAACTAARHRVHMLPVVDGSDTLLGVVRLENLLMPFIRADEEVEDQLRRVVIRPAVVAGACELEVAVRDGVARLSGWAASGATLQRLRHEIASVPGVVGLDVDVEVDPSLRVGR